MDNHVPTINPPTNTPIKPATIMCPVGDDYEVIDQGKGNAPLLPVMMDIAILPIIVKSKEY